MTLSQAKTKVTLGLTSGLIFGIVKFVTGVIVVGL